MSVVFAAILFSSLFPRRRKAVVHDSSNKPTRAALGHCCWWLLQVSSAFAICFRYEEDWHKDQFGVTCPSMRGVTPKYILIGFGAYVSVQAYVSGKPMGSTGILVFPSKQGQFSLFLEKKCS